MTRLEKLQSDRHAILVNAERILHRIERSGREQVNEHESRAFDAHIAAADRLQAAIDQVRI